MSLPTWAQRKKCVEAWSSRITSSSSGQRQVMRTIDPVLILDHLLNLLPSLSPSKYDGMLNEKGVDWIKNQVIGCLRPEVLNFCKMGRFDQESYGVNRLEFHEPRLTQSRLMSIGGDRKIPGLAVYLHIIWKRDDFEHFFLYAGQSTELAHRLAQHDSPQYRSKYPSLHYYVMGLEDMVSDYVILAENILASEYQSRILNILEMFAGLIFQTLDPKDLQKYLPEEVGSFLPFCGLNIALPLWQSSPDRKPMGVWHRVESSLLSPSSDSNDCEFSEVSQHLIHIKGYHKSLRERFCNLRFSLNPSHRAYYYEVKRRQNSSASASRTAKTRREVLLGARREVKSYRCQTVPGQYTIRRCIFIGSFCLWLPNSSAGSLSGKVYFKTEISNGQAHHSPYAMKATPDDPAIRLGIHICGTNALGNAISFWLQSRGMQNILKMNTLVDELEGKTDGEIEQTPRRWIAKNETRGRYKPSYT